MEKITSILQQCTITPGNVIKLPNFDLGADYPAVKKKLEEIGGKWKGGKVFGFVYQADPAAHLARLQKGENINLAKDYQFFGTSDKWANTVVELASIEDHMIVLEPEAGQGAIIKAIYRKHASDHIDIDYCELMPYNKEILHKLVDHRTIFIADDFLKIPEQEQYDRIVANPPFGNNQDIDHIYKMWKCLKPGGRIVTFCSRHYQISSNKKEIEFREWLNKINITIRNVPAKAFQRAGTSIDCLIFVIDKPE